MIHRENLEIVQLKVKKLIIVKHRLKLCIVWEWK